MPLPKDLVSESSADNEELDSTSNEEDNQTEDQVEDQQDGDENSEDNQAKSSNAEDSKSTEDEEHKSLLDVVKDAVEDKEEGEKPKAKSEDGEEDDENGEESDKTKDDASSASKAKSEKDDGSDEFTKEELAKEKPKTRERIQKLITKLEDVSQVSEEYKPRAERFDQIDGFMTENGISPNEAAEAFTIMALVKSNPEKALERLQAHVDNVSELVGVKLPADIQAKVEDGSLDEESALELSKARSRANLAQQREQAVTQQSQASQQATQQAQQTQNLAVTLDNWQAQKQQSDPDYAKKHNLVETKLRALVQQYGDPQSPDEVVQYANVAYGQANQMVQELTPKTLKKAKKAITSRGSSGPAPKAKTEGNASVLDVVRQAAGS